MSRSTDTPIALVVPTVSVPRVLDLHQALPRSGLIIIVGDEKSPNESIREFVRDREQLIYLSPQDQIARRYKCSELIGWNTITRRNVGVLEAVRHGAGVIVTIDDDNIPASVDFFSCYERLLGEPYHGIAFSSPDGVLNVGDFFARRFFHRGFPFSLRSSRPEYEAAPAVGVRIGVAAGMWLGDPDVNAVDRLSGRGTIAEIPTILNAGAVVSAGTFAPFNSQNTCFRAELAPLFMMWSGVGRYDDIWASYACQRFMWQEGLALHYGRPFVWHARNWQSNWTNLRDELLGMEWTETLLAELRGFEPHGGSLMEKARRLYAWIATLSYVPSVVSELGEAWCQDLAILGVE